MNITKTTLLFFMFFVKNFIQASEIEKINATSDAIQKVNQSEQKEQRTVTKEETYTFDNGRYLTHRIEYSNGDSDERTTDFKDHTFETHSYNAKTGKTDWSPGRQSSHW